MEIRIDPWKLRPWQPRDVDALVKYANNYAIWRNLRDTFPHPYTETDAREWSQRPNQSEPLTNLAIATADEAIGSIGLTLQDDVHFRSGEVGYWLGEPFWGQGIATRSLAGKPLAGFRATPSRRITVLYGMVMYIIRVKNPLLH